MKEELKEGGQFNPRSSGQVTLRIHGQYTRVFHLSGKMLQIGEGMVSSKIEQTPFRILDECPVYHSCSNEFNLADLEFRRDKAYLWGKFYHPFLMMGMPDVGGWNKLYIDTRINGWYILWISTKLNEDDFGPSDWLASIVSWTNGNFFWFPNK